MLKRELHDVRRPLLHLGRPVGVQFISATLALSKLRIELGPLLRVWSVEFDRRDDGAEVEVRGRDVQSGEGSCVHRRCRFLLSLGLGRLGEDTTLVAVVVAHRHGYGSGVIFTNSRVKRLHHVGRHSTSRRRQSSTCICLRKDPR